MASDLTPRTRRSGLPPERDLPTELELAPDLDPYEDSAPAGRRAASPTPSGAADVPAPLAAAQQVLPAPPAPSVAATSEAAPATERLTCPECGLSADVILNRRDSQDFCRGCDYPLFWVPSQILLGRVTTEAASLRRLPGTLGRTTVASLECPHCEELNAVSAVLCVRCGLELHPVPLPEPEPVPVVEPEPEPEPEPEQDSTWWAWVIIAVAVLLVLGSLAYIAFWMD